MSQNATSREQRARGDVFILLPEMIPRCHYKDTRANIWSSTKNHVKTMSEGDGSYICTLLGGGKHKGYSYSS
jgi:hypothetical protein